jgi:penicillin-binding protein-related factor A (putative recombinase)
MGLPEKEITKQIRDVLTACRVWHYKNYSGGAFNPRKGISDIIGCYKGRYLAIEVKREDWMPPNPHEKAWQHYKEQKDFIDEVINAGGIGFFANCPEDVIRELQLKAQLFPLFKK